MRAKGPGIPPWWKVWAAVIIVADVALLGLGAWGFITLVEWVKSK